MSFPSHLKSTDIPFFLLKKQHRSHSWLTSVTQCSVTTTNSLTQKCSSRTEHTYFMREKKNLTKSTSSLLLIDICYLHKRFANGRWNMASGWELNSIFNRSQKHVSCKARHSALLSYTEQLASVVMNCFQMNMLLIGNCQISVKIRSWENCWWKKMAQHLMHPLKNKDSLVLSHLIKVLQTIKAPNVTRPKQFWFPVVFIWTKCIKIGIQVFKFI